SAEEACRAAKAFVHAAISRAVPLGSGIGSLWHAAWRDGVGGAPGGVGGVRPAPFPEPT
ncbi:hypothetical protein H7B90_09865, partial [Cohnella xylanilytica]|nr:hypothetical protein [Cohnella xylanilytica]